MATATATVTLGRGYDPRDFTMIGYGGGAGLFLAEVCQELGIRRLVIPRAAATFSAYGLLFADSVHSRATTAEWLFGFGSLEEINDLYARLEREAIDALRREGFAEGDIGLRREADAKFLGQSFDIPISMPPGPLAEEDRASLHEHFVAEYTRVYGAGAAWEGFPVRLETARVVATGLTAKPPLASAAPKPNVPDPAGEREIHVGGRTVVANAYDGAVLTPGALITGPALVDDVDTTLLVPDGVSLEIDELRNSVFSIDVTSMPSPRVVADTASSAETVITR
jgi:N-methylhydantoinase A